LTCLDADVVLSLSVSGNLSLLQHREKGQQHEEKGQHREKGQQHNFERQTGFGQGQHREKGQQHHTPLFSPLNFDLLAWFPCGAVLSRRMWSSASSVVVSFPGDREGVSGGGVASVGGISISESRFIITTPDLSTAVGAEGGSLFPKLTFILVVPPPSAHK